MIKQKQEPKRYSFELDQVETVLLFQLVMDKRNELESGIRALRRGENHRYLDTIAQAEKMLKKYKQIEQDVGNVLYDGLYKVKD